MKRASNITLHGTQPGRVCIVHLKFLGALAALRENISYDFLYLLQSSDINWSAYSV
jgi:hypothetical protein